MNDRTNTNNNSNNTSNSNSNRITVTLDRRVYDRLKAYGHMGDSFSQLIDRILSEKEGKETNVDGRSF
jgi:predicted CopG family antitoxin